MSVRQLEQRDPESREWWQGWWETTVCWLEVQDGTVALLEREETFYSPEECSAYLKERVEGGWVYDVCWSHEVTLGGKGHPGVREYTEKEWTGFFSGEVVNEEDIQVT